ncbi:ATP-dependent metallopeptidase FtsH/Yme1/Tma family protein, partial [Aeromonas veronii]|nr:ATP-dependent metallopeptidase FtsH/Yme1/Tma family protein [Aeromonas veronii]
MNRIFRNVIFYLLIFLVIIGVVSFFQGANGQPEVMKYGKFVEHLETGDVKNITVQPERGVFEVRGQLNGYKEDQYFVTNIIGSQKEVDRIYEAAKNADV